MTVRSPLIAMLLACEMALTPALAQAAALRVPTSGSATASGRLPAAGEHTAAEFALPDDITQTAQTEISHSTDAPRTDAPRTDDISARSTDTKGPPDTKDGLDAKDAVSLKDTSGAKDGKNDEPVLLQADLVTHDEKQSIVTATGNVLLSQGKRVLRANTISYNQQTKIVVARGNVEISEPSGEVIFTDYAELTDDMRNGFIDHMRMIMADNARVAGNEAERVDGRYVRLNRGLYSPCDLCRDDPSKPPLWQVKAMRVVHDNETKDVRYRDATLEIAGIPVLYSPYFAHPDPTVDRRTGFLAPVFGHSKDLGSYMRNFYYIDVAPDKDATLEVTPFAKGQLLLGGEWRQRLEEGKLRFNGSITRGDYVEQERGRKITRPDTVRGNFAASGRFDIDDTWRWGFDAAHATDKTFLRQYYKFRDNTLDSRIFVEGFMGRNYASVSGLSFQELRATTPEAQPKVVPLMQYSALGDPGTLLGGRWSLDTGLVALTRDTGTSTRRMSFEPGWQRDFINDVGFISTLSASVRSDVYSVDSYRPPGLSFTTNNAMVTRVLPQAQMTMRYPLVREFGSVQNLVEPIVALTVAPNLTTNAKIPNEESQDLEFDDTNLFLPNRFPGFDRLDSGTRLTYGLRTGLYGFDGGSATLFLGQSYRLIKDVGLYPTGSGLDDHFSDYVGRVQIQPNEWFDLSYGFRYDKDTLKPRKHEISASFGAPIFKIRANYEYLARRGDPVVPGRFHPEDEYATVGFSTNLRRYWSLAALHAQAFSPNPGPRTSALALTYQDECFTFQTIGQRDFTKRPGVDPGTTIYFRLIFKNLGEVQSPTLSSALFGTQTTTTTSP